MATLVTFSLVLGGCTKFCSRKPTPPPPPANDGVKTPNYNGITVTHVVVRDYSLGKGKTAQQQSTVKVKYTEYVYDPAALGNRGPLVFEAKEPREITVGKNQVIKGFEEGLIGMRKGGRRNLIIPNAYAYGEAGQMPRIPPKAMIMIDVELIDVN